MESKMYESARVPVEAQAQSALRNIQESYYGRGIPGGASRSAAEQVEIGKGGTLGNLKFNIALKRAELGKSDLTNAINAAGGFANYQMGGAQNLANIYSNTISAVPGYLGAGGAASSYTKPEKSGYGSEKEYQKALEQWQKKWPQG
jgi:hypothetical protein